MKKIISVLVLSLLVCNLAFAARVKYNTITGEVISMSSTKDTKVGTNEALLDVQTEVVPDIQNYKVDPDLNFRKKTPAEISADTVTKDQAKADRKNRKKTIMTKLGLNKQELKALIELIEDGNDD